MSKQSVQQAASLLRIPSQPFDEVNERDDSLRVAAAGSGSCNTGKPNEVRSIAFRPGTTSNRWSAACLNVGKFTPAQQSPVRTPDSLEWTFHELPLILFKERNDFLSDQKDDA
ncbi:hypothetical protein [Desulfobulbus elongatus]|uniref:hypothetical protein n=1 Tax=Desulfobulbus elongatus TaxID=53332 RepID=UPI00146FB280|nr:hypothetical protein [Desulfobulbus elongatus]